MKILFFGDVVGKTGRLALKEALPKLREEYRPNAVIVNGENTTHGKGINNNAYKFYKDLKIDCVTGGDHVFVGDPALQYPCPEPWRQFSTLA